MSEWKLKREVEIESRGSRTDGQGGAMVRKRRLLVVMLLVVLPIVPAQLAQAQTLTFWAYDFYDHSYYRISATQQYVSTHARVYADIDSDVTYTTARQVGWMFDDIYADVTGVLGVPPDEDGDSRIYVLLTDIRDVYDHDPNAISFVRAYFDPINGTVGPYSNGHEMIYLDVGQQLPTEEEAKRAVAHELARMISLGADPDEEAWLVEGLGYLAERLCGLPHRPEIADYLSDPANSLTGWTMSRNDAGSTYLFVLYVYEQFGASAIEQIVASPQNGLDSVAAVVAMDTDLLFRRWALANYLDLGSGPYRYASLSIVDSGADNVTRFLRPLPTDIPRPARNQKSSVTGTLPYRGVTYYRMTAGSRVDPFIRVEDERPRAREWWPTLADGYGAAWLRGELLLQEGLLSHTSTDVPPADTFLLCIAPAREVGAVDYRYTVHGTYQTYLPLVMKSAP